VTRRERLWAPWRLEYVGGARANTACIFCAPEPELVVHQGEGAFVLLNRFPYTSGHLMVVPNRHAGDLAELTEGEALEVHRLAVTAIAALTAEYRPDGHNLGWNLGRAAGAGIVDHVHLHVVPRWSGDTNFMPVLADVRVIPEALAETCVRLRARWPAV
jgi:ATP adenylyltransferase